MSHLATLNFPLGEEIDMLRDTVQQLRRRRDRAARRRDRPQTNLFPHRPVAEARRARPARHDGQRGVRRRAAGLPRAHRRDGGGLARLGVGRPVVRRASQPVRQPAPPQRQRGAEEEVPAQAGLRRARRRAGDERAERRLRRRQHEAARRGEGRPLRAQRLKMWITNGGDADTLVVYAKTDLERRPARHHRLHHREGHARASRSARSSTSSACAARNTGAGVLRGLRGAGRERARRRGRRRQGADERPRLRARGALRRAARHHGGRAWTSCCPTSTSASSSARRSASSS